MLYKHLFSILCGHLNLNKKKIWIWPVTSQTGRLPSKPAGIPAKPAGIPVGTDWTWAFEFYRFRPVTGQTGPYTGTRGLRLPVTGRHSKPCVVHGSCMRGFMSAALGYQRSECTSAAAITVIGHLVYFITGPYVPNEYIWNLILTRPTLSVSKYLSFLFLEKQL